MGRKMPTVVRPYTDAEILALTYQGGKACALLNLHGKTERTNNPWKHGTPQHAEWHRGYDNQLAEWELLS